jgi:hypothetical protein
MLKRTAVVTSLVAALALGGTALGVAGNGAGPNKSPSSISLVMLNSPALSAAVTSGPHWGDQVTFAISTNATDQPYVFMNCYRDGTRIYNFQAGFYAAYPFTKTFTLSSIAWTGGAADCTANLGELNSDGTKWKQLASTSFHVDA